MDTETGFLGRLGGVDLKINPPRTGTETSKQQLNMYCVHITILTTYHIPTSLAYLFTTKRLHIIEAWTAV